MLLKSFWYQTRSSFFNALYYVRALVRPYNVVRIEQLPRTWSDRDAVMFHAVFQIIVDFVEKEHPCQPGDDNRLYTPDEMRAYTEKQFGAEAVKEQIQCAMNDFGWSYQDAVFNYGTPDKPNKHYVDSMAIIDIYEWYKYRRPARIDYFANVRWPWRHNDADDVFSELDAARYEEYNYAPKYITPDEYNDIIDEHELIDNAMFMKAVKLRYFLWT